MFFQLSTSFHYYTAKQFQNHFHIIGLDTGSLVLIVFDYIEVLNLLRRELLLL
jgi:hypothetical protein